MFVQLAESGRSHVPLSRSDEPVCEPDRRGVSDHREDHQPGRTEDFGSAGERLGPHLLHHQQQTREGQVNTCSDCFFIYFTGVQKLPLEIFELINSIVCEEEIKCRRILPAPENVILKPDVICLHAELMWLTTKAPVFTHSRAELWVSSFLPSLSSVSL